MLIIAEVKVIEEEVMNLREMVHKLLSPLTIDSIQAGQTEPPPLLLKFFEILHSGNKTVLSEKINRLIKSSADDVVCNFRYSHQAFKTDMHGPCHEEYNFNL